jgi:enoyl-CoA hydratase/carnithine racemase
MTSPPALTTELIDDVLIVTIDRPDHPVNTLGVELVDEFENAFRRVDEDTLIQALVLISGNTTASSPAPTSSSSSSSDRRPTRSASAAPARIC